MEPKTVYYELTASTFDWKISEHKTIKAWGFNNTVPGPSLKARKGDTMVINVKNNLDEPTVIHWHGIRLESSMDGTEDVQKPINPGEQFEYRFIVPDAGTFWYHSHYNETHQMERGMYGSLIVDEETNISVDADRVLMIDDMKLTKNNEFIKGGLISRWIERHDGREGDTVLINGREDFIINMHAGQTERWRFINASSARYVRLSLGGRAFKIIAGDGGLIENAKIVTEVLMTPGERIEILAGPFGEGEQFQIQSLPYNRTTFVKSKLKWLAQVKVGKAQSTEHFTPKHLREIKPLALHDAITTRKVKFSVGASLRHGIDFLVNGDVHTQDKPVNLGELQIWEIANTSLMDHPFHLHGFFFQVIEENGVATNNNSWKDTYNLTPKSKIKIAWIPDRTGSWMYHCHILEHHAAGMMAHFEVVNPGTMPTHSHKHHVHHH